jgi:hypothetical protein
MGFFAMYGYQAFRRFYYIMTPVLFLVLIFAVIHTLFLSEAGSAALLAWRPAEPVSRYFPFLFCRLTVLLSQHWSTSY